MKPFSIVSILFSFVLVLCYASPQLWFLDPFPPPFLFSPFFSVCLRKAEQLDAQVVSQLLVQVLDFITNSVGGGSDMCVCARLCTCGGVGGGALSTSVGWFERADETQVRAESVHGTARLRQEINWEDVVNLRFFIYSSWCTLAVHC